MKEDLRNFSLGQLQERFKVLNIERYRALQVFQWLHKKGVQDFEGMRNLSANLRHQIAQYYTIEKISVEEILSCRDLTQKFLFRLKDNAFIEAVSIPFKGRLTVCLSTQVGCRFACRFCASGSYGFKRNLEVYEILAQFMAIKNHVASRRVTHLVFMGIGEPLDNYENVIKAIRIFNAPEGAHLGIRKMTISTVGLPKGIERLAQEGLQVELSISLHAASDEKRSRIIALNKKYPIAMLMEAVKKFIKATKRKVTFEYILLGGYNTANRDAGMLVGLLRGMNVRVNLIAYNATPSSGDFIPPTKLEALFFKNYLLKHGLDVTLRKPRGVAIGAACGQLRFHALRQRQPS